MNQYRFKYWLYDKDQLIIGILLVLLFIIIVAALADIGNQDLLIKPIEFRAWVAMVVGLITLLFAFMRQKHNDMSIFYSQFEKFNDKYDSLNDRLNTIHKVTSDEEYFEEANFHPFEAVGKKAPKKGKENLQGKIEVENVLDDYLNLCAEEHLAYSNGYVPPEIMKYWVNGMKIFFGNMYIREYFEQELSSDSYYEFKEFAEEQFDLTT